ncbi:MAG: hypothetical protein KKF56_03590 [Nanoarchaeota archaeon]|nr:hypothetical protein [Nanoarchaeota archaeon]
MVYEGLTKQQRRLAEVFADYVAKTGAEVVTKTIPFREPAHTEIWDYIERVRKWQEESRKSDIRVTNRVA